MKPGDESGPFPVMSNVGKDFEVSNAESPDTSKLRALVNHIPAAVYRCRADDHFTLYTKV